MAFNIVCFIRSISKMRKLEQNSQMLRAQKQENKLIPVYLKISTVFGLGWASAFLAVFFPVFSYLFVILTAFQGVYIFFAFVYCLKDRNAYNLLCNVVHEIIQFLAV